MYMQYDQIDSILYTAFASMGVFLWLICLGIVVLTVIAMWKIYSKAGEPGWKCLIPFYNTYTLYKIAWKTKMFWWTIILIVAGYVSLLIGIVCFAYGADAPGMDPASIVAFVLTFVSLALFIAAIVIEVRLNVKLSKSFGQGGAFAVGLIFLNTIFVLILGLGRSSYIGPEGIPAAPAASSTPTQQ